nr:hypothetical protein [Tanacetum cinerariifolium]
MNVSMIELRETFQAWLQQRQDQVVNIDSYSSKPSQCQKIPIYYDDDDDEERSTPLRDIIISELPPCIAITPVLYTKDPNDSLSIGDEHLDTIPEKESDEFIKSSVENLVPNPSESEDLSNIRGECDVPVCDDFTTFSNLLFDADDNFSSSDDKSFSDEDISKEIYSNPLFNKEIISIKIDPHHFNAESDLIESLFKQDSSIISSSKIDSLLDEFAGKLFFLKSIPPGIDEADCDPEKEIRLIEKLLYDNSSPRPLKEPNFENSDVVIESFSPSHIPVEGSDSLIEEIGLFLTSDDLMPPGIENDEYDSEGDILFLEELLSNDSPSLPENELFHFDVPSSPRPHAKPPDDDGIYFDDEPDKGILTVKVNSLNDSPSISENSSQSPPHINHHCCYECGDPLDGIFCKRCTCKSCGKGTHIGYNCPQKVLVISNPEPCKNQTIDELPQNLTSFHPTCYSGDESPFTCHSTPNIFYNSPNVFNPPPQPPKYSYEFCRNGAYYGHDCPPQISDEFIKASVENLIPSPCEYEDLSDSKCDVPACDDFTTFSNIFIDANDDLSSSNNKSFFDEDILKEIYSNPLFDEEIISMKIDLHHFKAESDLIESLLNHDSSIISSYSKIYYLLDEFSEFISKNSDAVIKSLSPSPIPVDDSDSFMEEIDLSFTLDDPMSPGIKEDDYDSEKDILILEELLSNDSLSLLENESFHFDIPSSTRPPAKPPDGNSGISNVKVMGDISKYNVPMPRLMLTQPTLVLNKEESPNLLSHQGYKASQPFTECPMMIYGRNTPILDVPFLHFYPP